MNKKFFEKKVARFGFVAFALALGLVACGDGGSTNGPANDDDSSSSSSVSGSPSSSSEKSGSISSSSSPRPNSSSSEINGDNSGENGAFFITKNVTTSLSTMGTSTVTAIAYNYLDIQSQYLYETLYSMSMYSNDKLISSSISKAAYIKDGSSCGAGFDACNRICAGDVPFYVSGTQTCADIEFVGEVNSYKKYKISGDSYSYYDKEGVLRITESGSMKIEYYDKKVMDNFTYRCARTSQNGSLLYDACEEFKVLKSTNSNVSIQTSYTYSGMNVVNLVEYEYFKFGYTSNGITTNGSSSSVASSSSSSVIPGSSSSVIPGTDPGSSGSVASSSSMKAAWAYLNPKIDYGEFTDERDGQVYKTVKIGARTWMAENLNYAPTNVSSMGSYAWSGCYNNESANCSKYGRLYTWEVAMDKAGCGYGTYCNNSNEGTQGVCPSGWHLPTKEDWQKLVNPMEYAGIELKTVDDWYLDDWYSSSKMGTNASGFSALPAGSRVDYGNFSFAGLDAGFWSASESNDSCAYFLFLIFSSDYAELGDYGKGGAFSVRCLKDSGSVTSSSSVVSSSSTSVPGSSSSVIPGTDPGSSSSVASSSSMKAAWAYLNPKIDYGEFTDERDGQVYKTVKIGARTWMAENLNYAYTGVKYNYSSYTSDSTSWCYENKASNCDKYGRLYTWSAVMDSAAQFNVNAGTRCGYGKTCTPNSPHRGICPEGWHVPTYEEYSTLYTYIGGSGTAAGSLLKSTSGWNDYNGKSGNGTDKYGFSVLPAGVRDVDGRFGNEGNRAYLWSATEFSSDFAWDHQYFYYDYDFADQCYDYKIGGLSLRCLKD